MLQSTRIVDVSGLPIVTGHGRMEDGKLQGFVIKRNIGGTTGLPQQRYPLLGSSTRHRPGGKK